MDDVLNKTDSDGDPNVFNVDCDNDELWLNANYANPSNVWNPGNVWVFCLSNYLYSPPFFGGVFLFR
jgi:hypothetical protein